MALYLDADRYCLLTSTDALNWQKIQNLELLGDRECPDFFPLTDDTGREHWVFSGACGNYVLGTFDGINFEPQTPVKRMEHGTNGYAAQTWSNSPDSRKSRSADGDRPHRDALIGGFPYPLNWG